MQLFVKALLAGFSFSLSAAIEIRLQTHSTPQTKVPDAPSDCDKGKGLPTPHGHPEAAAKDKKSKHEEPAACQQLEVCIANVNQDQYTVGFNKCVNTFCDKLHADKKFEEKDDPRTALCDKDGKKAMDAIAKATTEAKKPTLLQAKSPLIALTMVQSLFAKDFTSSEIQQACRV